jgi:hypothetical protein
MTATSSVSTRAIPETQTDVHPLKYIAVFCAVVIGASLPDNLWLGFERRVFLAGYIGQ